MEGCKGPGGDKGSAMDKRGFEVSTHTPLQPAAVAAWVVHWRMQGERPTVEEGTAALPLVVD